MLCVLSAVNGHLVSLFCLKCCTQYGCISAYINHMANDCTPEYKCNLPFCSRLLVCNDNKTMCSWRFGVDAVYNPCSTCPYRQLTLVYAVPILHWGARQKFTGVTQRHSVAKSVGCFLRRLFVCVFLSVFVCLFVNTITSERVNIG